MEQKQPSQSGSFCSLPNTNPSAADQCVIHHNGVYEVEEAGIHPPEDDVNEQMAPPRRVENQIACLILNFLETKHVPICMDTLVLSYFSKALNVPIPGAVDYVLHGTDQIRANIVNSTDDASKMRNIQAFFRAWDTAEIQELNRHSEKEFNDTENEENKKNIFEKFISNFLNKIQNML